MFLNLTISDMFQFSDFLTKSTNYVRSPISDSTMPLVWRLAFIVQGYNGLLFKGRRSQVTELKDQTCYVSCIKLFMLVLNKMDCQDNVVKLDPVSR